MTRVLAFDDGQPRFVAVVSFELGRRGCRRPRLRALAPSPVVTLNRAVAVAMVDGPRAGLADLDALDGDRRLASHHRLASVRAHLHEMAGDTQAALAGTRMPPAARRASPSSVTCRPRPNGCGR